MKSLTILSFLWKCYNLWWLRPGVCELCSLLAIFCLSFSLLFYATLSLYLKNYERTIPMRKSSFQTDKLIGTSTLWGGKDWAGPFSPPPPKCLAFLFIFQSLSLCFTLSLYQNTYEWYIPKRESSFQTDNFIGTSRLWDGERLGRSVLPTPHPSKMFWPFYLSFSLSVNATPSLYLNTYKWSIPKRESSYQIKQFIWTVTLWGG